MKINILDTEWSIEYRNNTTDPLLNEREGYVDPSVNLIVIANKRQDDDVMDFAMVQRRTLRHEIIHAFLYESGLGANFIHPGYGHDEIMIDWVALQFPKLQKAFEEAGCL